MRRTNGGDTGVPQRPGSKLTNPIHCELHCLGNGGCLVSSCGDVPQQLQLRIFLV